MLGIENDKPLKAEQGQCKDAWGLALSVLLPQERLWLYKGCPAHCCCARLLPLDTLSSQTRSSLGLKAGTTPA